MGPQHSFIGRGARSAVMNKLVLLASMTALAFAGQAAGKPGHPSRPAKGEKVTKLKDEAPVGYGVGGCPPGLAKKNPQCMPPGRHRKLFEVGQRVPYNFQGLTGYDGLPDNVRRQHGAQLDPRSRYIYDQGTLYRVDPATMVVSQILQTVLR